MKNDFRSVCHLRWSVLPQKCEFRCVVRCVRVAVALNHAASPGRVVCPLTFQLLLSVSARCLSNVPSPTQRKITSTKKEACRGRVELPKID